MVKMYKIIDINTKEETKVKGDKGLFEFIEDEFENPNIIVKKIQNALTDCIWAQYSHYKICRYIEAPSLECDYKTCFFRVNGYCTALQKVPIESHCGLYKKEETVKNKVKIINE